jgi:hypothetical protein
VPCRRTDSPLYAELSEAHVHARTRATTSEHLSHLRDGHHAETERLHPALPLLSTERLAGDVATSSPKQGLGWR